MMLPRRIPFRLLILACGLGFSSVGAAEPPDGMVLVPGGKFRPGLSAAAEAKLEALWTAERDALRAWFARHPRLQPLTDQTELSVASLLEQARKVLAARKGLAERDGRSARNLAAEHPSDLYLRSRVDTFAVVDADLRVQEALLDAIAARLAFIESQRTWLDEERNQGNPLAEVEVRPFFMDRTPVTVAQYRAFAEATGRDMPWPWQAATSGEVNLRGHPRSLFPEQAHPSFARDDSPIAGVSHADAVAYAAWAGKRLPTEIEWEWAARGGREDPLFPWGDHLPDGSQANLGGAELVARSPDNPNHIRIDTRPDLDRFPVLAPVDAFPAHGYGLLGMVGNVLQWCQADPAFDPNLFEVLAGRAEPIDPEVRRRWGNPARTFQPLRGAAYTDMPFEARITRRYGAPANHTHAERGFRCVRDVGGQIGRSP